MDDALTDLAVIILVGNEERHIRRCLERLVPLRPRQVVVVESQTGDRTHDVAVATAKCLNWRIEEYLNEEEGRGGWSTVVASAFAELRRDKEAVLFQGWPRRSVEGIDAGGGINAEEQRSRGVGGSTLHLVFHTWPGNQAKQFNWALDFVEGQRLEVGGQTAEKNSSVEPLNSDLEPAASWILRLDADEYLTEETCARLREYLGPCRGGEGERENVGRESGSTTVADAADSSLVTGIEIDRMRVFCGKVIRHGGTARIPMLRVFRLGIGRCEDRAMDEHIIVSSGRVEHLDGAFYDDNLNDMNWWREKHRGYAKREAADALAFARGELHFKREKAMYYRWPRYFRAVLYFGVRYFLKGGFLDGYAGWMWNFWQGLWYRWMVDREIGRLGER